MKIINCIGLALATVMLFVQCDKQQSVPDLVEEDDTPSGEDDTGNPDPLPYPDASEWAHWEEDKVFFGKNNWTECIVGDIPLIITAPHGGNIQPAGIPIRSCSGAATANDANTQPLTREIRAYMRNTYGKSPYIIVNHLHRNRIDQNRDLHEAICEHTDLMTEAWNDFHGYVDTALWKAVTEHGYALYIDIHGHGRSTPRLEIGYRLSATDLKRLYDSPALAGLTLLQKASIRDVFLLFDRSNSDFHDLIMGENAFGTLIASEGIRAVPSQDEPHLQPGEPYFNGGYNTARYTGDDYPRVYGFQIECHRPVRDNRTAFVRKLSKALLDYVELTKP